MQRSGTAITRITKESMEKQRLLCNSLLTSHSLTVTAEKLKGLSWVTFPFKMQRSGTTITRITKQSMKKPAKIEKGIMKGENRETELKIRIKRSRKEGGRR